MPKTKKNKKYHVTFLLDKSNNWIEKYLINFNFNLKKKFFFKIKKNFHLIKNQDLVFVLSYTKILSEKFILKNKLNIVVHSSKLPKDRGFSPVQNQVLRGKSIIDISLIKLVKKVDSGDIFLRDKYKINNTDLNDEIRKKQAIATLKIIKKFLIKFPNINKKKQSGKASFNKRRNFWSNKLDINKSIRSQINLLRIADNDRYPCFFEYKKKIFKIKIYK
ncbi:methionyl-tRNA formyltransferase [Pelagibacterales bacterium SAG-MED01]|nr:methionyl-tRNA formyltransferase [Pelagibacterales bacterium SAG-MED01]